MIGISAHRRCCGFTVLSELLASMHTGSRIDARKEQCDDNPSEFESVILVCFLLRHTSSVTRVSRSRETNDLENDTHRHNQKSQNHLFSEHTETSSDTKVDLSQLDQKP